MLVTLHTDIILSELSFDILDGF